MGKDYELSAVDLGGMRAVFIAPSGRPNFLEEMSSRKSDRRDATLIAKTISRVAQRGTEWALISETMKRLHGVGGDIAVFETRNNEGKPLRVATYLHDDPERTPVYLFPFVAHKGSDGGIAKDVRKKAERLASEARGLMLEEENEGRR